MKKPLLMLLAALCGFVAKAQMDTIYSNNEIIPCSVKEIAQDAVKFTYPGEEVINTVYKNSVQKIIFKSGRVQQFSESTALKKVAHVRDFDNVTITQVEGETKGLFKMGDVSSKAKGTTTLSNQERVKERAYKKLKIQAAIMGANVVYLTNQRSEGNKAGGNFYGAAGYGHSGGTSAETSLSGVAYSSNIPNFKAFETLIGSKRVFMTNEQNSLWSSGSDLETVATQKSFTIINIINENGLIVLDARIDGKDKYTKFRVVSFDDSAFYVFFEDKSTVYNLRVVI